MGMDKEAMDIWKFGCSRPDLSPSETFAAEMPELDETERQRRATLVKEYADRRTDDMARGVMIAIHAMKQARAAKS